MLIYDVHSPIAFPAVNSRSPTVIFSQLTSIDEGVTSWERITQEVIPGTARHSEFQNQQPQTFIEQIV